MSGDNKIAKVSVVGVGMRSHAGVATRMFDALAAENINILMISTSEIKISVVVAERYLELAVRCIHSEFDLGVEATEEEPRSDARPAFPRWKSCEYTRRMNITLILLLLLLVVA